MRSFTLSLLSPDEFDAFALHHPQGNFQQTSTMGALRVKEGKTVEYLGVKEHDELKAVAVMQIVHTGHSAFALIHDGPLCDFDDAELLRFLTDGLKRHAKNGGAAQLDIIPEAVYRRHEQTGEPVGEADDAMVENLKADGFDHVSGFSTGYSSVPRWRFVKDLAGITDEKSLLASYGKSARRNVKIARNSAVVVRQLDRSELPTFYHICDMSAERQHFSNQDLSFFERIYDTFGDQARFLIAEVHLVDYLHNWEDKLRDGRRKVEQLRAKLADTKYPDDVSKQIDVAERNVAAAERRIEQARTYIDRDGDVVPAAAALFIDQPRETVYLMSGSDDRYAKFYAPTAIQHEVMLDCVERGIDRYNFYGISGVFDDPADPSYGVLEFKQGFNGYVEELPGEFVLPVKPVTYALKQVAHKVLGR